MTTADLLSFSARTEISDSPARSEKSPNALRTISEASELLDVPQHVLRFWETKFSQINPLKRNGGRRFYRPEDIEVLQQVKFLLYKQGYTIKGAKKAIEEYAKIVHSTSRGDAAAKLEERTLSAQWQASVPKANVNDNLVVAEAAVEARAAAPRMVQLPSVPAPTNLRELKSELSALRAVLSQYLPPHSK